MSFNIVFRFSIYEILVTKLEVIIKNQLINFPESNYFSYIVDECGYNQLNNTKFLNEAGKSFYSFIIVMIENKIHLNKITHENIEFVVNQFKTTTILNKEFMCFVNLLLKLLCLQKKNLPEMNEYISLLLYYLLPQPSLMLENSFYSELIGYPLFIESILNLLHSLDFQLECHKVKFYESVIEFLRKSTCRKSGVENWLFEVIEEKKSTYVGLQNHYASNKINSMLHKFSNTTIFHDSFIQKFNLGIRLHEVTNFN